MPGAGSPTNLVASTAPVLIVGAGPAGLAIASCLKREGVEFDLVDRTGVAGGAYQRMYPGLTLLSRARYTRLPGLDWHPAREYVTVSEYRTYLTEYVAAHELQPVAAEVQQVVNSDGRFQVLLAPRLEGPPRHATPDGRGQSHILVADRTTTTPAAGSMVEATGSASWAEYRALIVATGMFDSPFIPEFDGLPMPSGTSSTVAPIEGCPAVLHSRAWPGPKHFADQRVLIVGGGMSGVELAEQCAAAGVPATLSSRHRIRLLRQRICGRDIHDYVHLVSHRLPRWVLGSFCDRLPALPAYDCGFRAFIAGGQITVRGDVRRWTGLACEFADGSYDDFDAVILATGYRFRTPFLPEWVARGARGQPVADGGRSRSCPGLFFVGTPCCRCLPSEFLHGIAHDAPAIAQQVRRWLR